MPFRVGYFSAPKKSAIGSEREKECCNIHKLASAVHIQYKVHLFEESSSAACQPADLKPIIRLSLEL